MRNINLYKKMFQKKEKRYGYQDMGILDAFQYLFSNGLIIRRHRSGYGHAHGNLGSL